MAKTKEAALLELADLGKSLAEVVEDRQETTATLNKILDLVGSLDKDDAKALFKNEQVQRLIEAASTEVAEASDGGPGTILPGPFGQKKPWNEADLVKLIEQGKMEMVRNYRPITTMPIIWNGLRRNFVARQPITCPGCFVAVYEEHLTAEELAEQHAAWLFRKRNTLFDPSAVTENGVRARGIASEGQGHYVPGGGIVTTAEDGE